MKKTTKNPELIEVDSYVCGLDFVQHRDGSIYPLIRYFNRETGHLIFTLEQGKITEPHQYARWFFKFYNSLIHLTKPCYRILFLDNSSKQFEYYEIDYEREEREFIQHQKAHSPDRPSGPLFHQIMPRQIEVC